MWAQASLRWQRWTTIQVVIDSMGDTTLFNAVVDCVEQVAEKRNETCSCDVEAFTIYGKTDGRTQVKMRFVG